MLRLSVFFHSSLLRRGWEVAWAGKCGLLDRLFSIVFDAKATFFMLHIIIYIYSHKETLLSFLRECKKVRRLKMNAGGFFFPP